MMYCVIFSSKKNKAYKMLLGKQAITSYKYLKT